MMHRNDRLERLVSKHAGSKRGKRRSARQKRLDGNRARRATMEARTETLNKQITEA